MRRFVYFGLVEALLLNDFVECLFVLIQGNPHHFELFNLFQDLHEGGMGMVMVIVRYNVYVCVCVSSREGELFKSLVSLGETVVPAYMWWYHTGRRCLLNVA